MTDPLLPMAEAENERCDAARNRRRLMDAAVTLVDSLGADAVTMDAVAVAAGVGKGTVFRRFGNRAGLMMALLDHTERELQQGFMFGPPPLGPGADPIDRIIAFGHARLAMVHVQGEVLRAAESSPESRYAAPAHHVSMTHISTLLRQVPVHGDVQMLAYALLAPLEATLVLHQLRDLGMTSERLSEGWTDLVRRITRDPDQPYTDTVDSAASTSATP